MSENIDLFDIFLKKDFTEAECKKMIEIIHSQMEKFSGNEEILGKLLAIKIELYKKSPDDDRRAFRAPRRYALDETNLPTLKMGTDDWGLDFDLANISKDIAELKPGERIALGRNTSFGNQDGIVKRMDVFWDEGICARTVSRRHCDICRNEAGKLELIDMSISATRVVHSPKRKGFPASFKVIENQTPEISGKTQNLDEANLPKLKLALVDFDLSDISDDLKKLENGKCIAFGRKPTEGIQTNVAQHIEIGKDDRTVSRRHCNIWRIDGELVLEDCSLNGTTVLPKPKNQTVILSHSQNTGR